MTKDEAMQMALDWFDWFQHGTNPNGAHVLQVEEALRTALAQPEKEWVGLTRTELIRCGVFPWGMSYELCCAVEKKLKEKNT